MAIQEGRKAPAFTLTDAEGGKVSLRDFAGQHVVLYFYPRDDTPGCTKEACGFRELWKKLQDRGAVVIGVTPIKIGRPADFDPQRARLGLVEPRFATGVFLFDQWVFATPPLETALRRWLQYHAPLVGRPLPSEPRP